MKGSVQFQDIVYLSLCYVYSQIHWFFMIQFTVYASSPFVYLLEGKTHPYDILALEAHPF